jgi:hypothetical protein
VSDIAFLWLPVPHPELLTLLTLQLHPWSDPVAGLIDGSKEARGGPTTGQLDSVHASATVTLFSLACSEAWATRVESPRSGKRSRRRSSADGWNSRFGYAPSSRLPQDEG